MNFLKIRFFLDLKNPIFAPRFYQISETGLSAQSHKQHGRHTSTISGYTLAEQKVSKQQLNKVSTTPCKLKESVLK